MTDGEKRYQEAVYELRSKINSLDDDYAQMRITALKEIKETNEFIYSKRDLEPRLLEIIYNNSALVIRNMINVIDDVLNKNNGKRR